MKVLEKIKKEINAIVYPSEKIRCHLEEECVTDLMEASSYGWKESVKQILEIIHLHISDEGWIPVEKALPEEKVNPITRDFYEYEVTFRSDKIRDIRHYKFGKGHWWHGGRIVDEYVVAWREMPEPYKGDEKT